MQALNVDSRHDTFFLFFGYFVPFLFLFGFSVADSQFPVFEDYAVVDNFGMKELPNRVREVEELEEVEDLGLRLLP